MRTLIFEEASYIKMHIYDALDNINGQINNPNDRNFDSRLIVTLSNTSSTNNFCNRYNRHNMYEVSNSDRLAIGNEIQINDGTYNQRWIIAGFDLEHDHMASDSSVVDNGYGIFLIPKTQLMIAQWNTSNDTSGGYLNSYMNKTVLPQVASNLRRVLGSHLISRRVLLSNSISGNNANSYQWTNAECTLMSIGQMTGTFGANNTVYDDGEAIYKLPVFNFMDKKTGSTFWSRGIYTSYGAWLVDTGGSISDSGANDYDFGVRPLIMIR